MTDKKIYLLIKSIAGKAGGAERVVVNVANELSRCGFEVSILTFEKSKNKPFYDLDKEVVLFNLYPRHRKAGNTKIEVNSNLLGSYLKDFNNNKTLSKISNKLEWYGSNGIFLRNLTKYLKYYPPYALISFLPNSFSVAHLACRTTKVKHVVSEHNVPEQDFANPERWDPNPYDIHLRWEAVKQCDAMTVLFDEFKEWFPASIQDKINVITNYVSPPDIELKPILNRQKRIIAVGRLAYPKNHEVLIKAWSLIYKEFPEWKVEIYGDGPLKRELTELIEILEVQNLYLKGITENVWDLYADSQIFCIPSRFEGFGLVTVEAMMMGLPAIGFKNCEGTNRIIKPESGILVDEIDEEKLANSLKLLINDDSLRQSYSYNSTKSVEGFNKNKIIPKWIEMIELL